MQTQFKKIRINYFAVNIPHIIRGAHYTFVRRFLHIENTFVDREPNNQLPSFYNFIIALISRSKFFLEPFTLHNDSVMHCHR